MQTAAVVTNTKLVQNCYKLFKEGNINELVNQFSDNVQWSVPGPSEIPWAGKREGKSAITKFFQIFGENVEAKMEPREYIEQGNKVVALGHAEMKMKKTGKTAKEDWAMVFTLKNGKITHFQEYSDTYRTAEALRSVKEKLSKN